MATHAARYDVLAGGRESRLQSELAATSPYHQKITLALSRAGETRLAFHPDRPRERPVYRFTIRFG